MNSKLRIDKYLWNIRIFKTRTQATAACDSGKIRCNGTVVKAAKAVAIGDEYDIKTESRKWIITVSGLINHRVQYSEAVKYYVDITPEEDKGFNSKMTSAFYTGKRMSKTGRLTKKQRRDWESWMGKNQ